VLEGGRPTESRPKQHSEDRSIIPINFTTVPGHVKDVLHVLQPSTLRSGFNFARESFYIGPLNILKCHPGDICIIMINFTSIPGHFKYLMDFLQPPSEVGSERVQSCPRNFLYWSAKHPERPSGQYMYDYN
jgi:hypothetical protein